MSLKVLHIDLPIEGLAEALEANSELMPSGCREWRGTTRRGYGALNWGGQPHSAHRLVLWLEYGNPDPERPWALHHCDNKLCIRLEHLYWGSPGENTRDMKERGRASGGRAGATRCVNGHEFTEENTYWEPRGWGRACKECRRERVREFRQRQKVSA